MKKENVINFDPHEDTSTVIVFEKIEDVFYDDYFNNQILCYNLAQGGWAK